VRVDTCGVCYTDLHYREGGINAASRSSLGGPEATGRSYSDFPMVDDSIRRKLLTLPPETVVLTGHGEPTTIGDEAPHLSEWIDRGH
jgi:glyoxylase-like metal-dependent hydrolase (beta-lactamase superfamily II)